MAKACIKRLHALEDDPVTFMLIDEVVLENAKVIALTGNNAFSVKKLLSVDDLTTNYLV